MITDTVLTRDCEVTEIPSGTPSRLAAGTPVRIMQKLGGTYTVSTVWGQLARIEPSDLDALGLPAEEAPNTGAPAEFSEDLVWKQLKTVYDPEIPVNIVDLGLVYECNITADGDGHDIEIKMSMTAPGCGMGNVLRADIERRLAALPGVNSVHVEVVFDPPWHSGLMTEAAKLQLGLY